MHPATRADLDRCRAEQHALLIDFGPMTSCPLSQIGHMDWLIEELMIMESLGLISRKHS